MGQPAFINSDGSDYVPNPQESTPNSSGAGKSSSTRTTEKTYDPLEWAKLVQVGTALAGSGGQIDLALQDYATQVEARKAAEIAQVGAVAEAGRTAAAATQAATEIDVGNATRRANILTAANINPDNVENQLFKTYQIINDTAAMMDPLGRDIDQRAAVGIFDNPLEFFINQTRLPGMVGQYNALANTVNRASETAKLLETLAANQVSLSQTMDADKIKKAGDAKAADDAAKAQEKLTGIQKEAAAAATRDATNKLAMLGQKFQIQDAITSKTAVSTSESEGQSERASLKEAEMIQLEAVNKHRALIGAPAWTLPEFRGVSPKKRATLIELSGKTVIADKLSDSIELINTQGNLEAMANQGDSTAVNWVREAIRAGKQQENTIAKTQSMTSGAPKLKEEELRSMGLNIVQETYIQQIANDMSKAPPSNPAKISFPFMAKNLKLSEGGSGEDGVPTSGSKVIEYLNSPDFVTKLPVANKITDVLLLDKFVAETEARNITAGEAAKQLASFYKAAVVTQAERTKYPLFNIPYTGNYLIKLAGANDIYIPFEGIAGGVTSKQPDTVDMTNAGQLEMVITKLTAARSRARLSLPTQTMGEE